MGRAPLPRQLLSLRNQSAALRLVVLEGISPNRPARLPILPPLRHTGSPAYGALRYLGALLMNKFLCESLCVASGVSVQGFGRLYVSSTGRDGSRWERDGRVVSLRALPSLALLRFTNSREVSFPCGPVAPTSRVNLGLAPSTSPLDATATDPVVRPAWKAPIPYRGIERDGLAVPSERPIRGPDWGDYLLAASTGTEMARGREWN